MNIGTLYIVGMAVVGCLYGWSTGSGELWFDTIVNELKEINSKLDREDIDNG